MKIILIFLPFFVEFAYGRGPHHPRGEQIKHKHVHYKPSRETTEKLTQDVQLLHDKEHIQEHLEEVIKEPDLSTFTDEELEFYYFQVHDADKNSKLDGLEILQAILHTTDHDRGHEEPNNNTNSEGGEHYVENNTEDEMKYYTDLIDRVLEEDDKDNDGYLSYPEYVEGRRNKAIADQKSAPVVNIV